MHTKCCEFRKFLRTKQRARLANTQFFLGKKCDVQLTATKWTNDKIHKHIFVYLCACVCVCVSAAHAHLECVRIKQRANASLRVNVSVRILTSVYTGMWWAETCIPICCACVCLCVRAYCCVGVHQFMTVSINIFLFLRWFDLSQYTQNTHRARFDATIITYFYDCWLFFLLSAMVMPTIKAVCPISFRLKIMITNGIKCIPTFSNNIWNEADLNEFQRQHAYCLLCKYHIIGKWIYFFSSMVLHSICFRQINERSKKDNSHSIRIHSGKNRTTDKRTLYSFLSKKLNKSRN